MNRRYLVVTLGLLLVVILGISITSRSNLNPAHGVDYLFYGGFSDFFAQELTTGDFNNDGLDDIVVTGLWDNTSQDGPVHENVNGCAQSNWGRWKFTKAAETKYVCAFLDDDYYGPKQWQYWVDRGWTPVDTLTCGTCDYADWMSVDNGAAYVFMGGSWSGKPRDNNLAVTTPPADHMIVGGTAGDKFYNGLGAGDLDGDGYDELVLGATEAAGALAASPGRGKVCVMKGQSSGNSWPSVSSRKISLPSDALVSHTFRGRHNGDEFGEGIVVGDLDHDGNAEVVVAAPGGDGKDTNPKTNSGNIYIFYSNSSLAANPNPDLGTYSTDSAMLAGTSGYLQVIWGAAAYNKTGVTEIPEWHEAHNHSGDYDPVGLAIGFWDEDEFADLAIGSGNAEGGKGAVYVFFGGPSTVSQRKLKPGNTLDLAASVGSSTGPDVKIVGKGTSPTSPELGGALGAGLAFVDADGQSYDDLIIGAPRIHPDGYSQANYDIGTSAGEAYLIFGDTRSNLTGSGKNSRELDNSGMVDVTIKGAGSDDQIGGHFSGKFDVDNDGKPDIGLGGQDIVYLIFGQTRSAWTSTMDLATTLQTHPETRVLSWSGSPHANSTTIRLLDLNGDGRKDLVFGGYDLPGYGDPNGTDQYHAGEMWVTKGADVWRHSATISSNTTWSGNIFLDGDIKITSGTLTIAAGTDVWVWPKAFGTNLGASSTLVEIRAEGGSLVIQGTEQNPVRIQAWNLEPDQTTANDSWFGIWINDNSMVTIDHAEIRNALNGIQSLSSLTLRNSTIENCREGLTIDGAGASLDSAYVTSTTIRNIAGNSDGSLGVSVLHSNGAVRLNNCRIENCRIGVRAGDHSRLWALADTIATTVLWGVRVNSNGYGSLTNCIIEDAATHALEVYSSAHVWAGGCTIKTSDIGADVGDSGGGHPRLTLSECTVTGNDTGLHVTDTPNVDIPLSHIDNNSTDGVYCLSGANIVVAFATMNGNNTGLRCDDSNVLITDNTISGNAHGIVCEGFAYPTLRRNKVWSNGTGIAFADDSSADMSPCGGEECSGCEDANSFKTSTYYHVSTFTNPIYATCNYWGKSVPRADKFYGDVYYIPYLSSDPLPTSMKPREEAALPRTYALSGNSPNPFNPTTTIRYDVPSPGGQVRIRIYNVQGQLVRTLISRNEAAGQHQVMWDGTDQRGSGVASGVYFLEMTASQFRATRKIMMLK